MKRRHKSSALFWGWTWAYLLRAADKVPCEEDTRRSLWSSLQLLLQFPTFPQPVIWQPIHFLSSILSHIPTGSSDSYQPQNAALTPSPLRKYLLCVSLSHPVCPFWCPLPSLFLPRWFFFFFFFRALLISLTGPHTENQRKQNNVFLELFLENLSDYQLGCPGTRCPIQDPCSADVGSLAALQQFLKSSLWETVRTVFVRNKSKNDNNHSKVTGGDWNSQRVMTVSSQVRACSSRAIQSWNWDQTLNCG